jgi:hypothetical protein
MILDITYDDLGVVALIPLTCILHPHLCTTRNIFDLGFRV